MMPTTQSAAKEMSPMAIPPDPRERLCSKAHKIYFSKSTSFKA